MLIPVSVYAVDDQKDQPEQKTKVCTAQYDPVCGVDGKTYSNLCVLQSTDITFDYEGECVGSEPEVKRKILCKDGTIGIDGVCKVAPIDDEKPVETSIEKPSEESVDWLSSLFDWFGSLFQ